MTDKPDISRAWASSGEKINADENRRFRGWEPNIPFYQFENYQQNIQDKYLQHLENRGIPQWDSATQYKVNAWAHYSGDLWIALIPNTGTAPGSNAGVWTGYLNIIDPVGVIKWYSGVTDKIPYGWALCNGSGGTPNLSDRFLRGGDTPGNRGGSTNVTTTSNGSHGHTLQAAGSLGSVVTGNSGTHSHVFNSDGNHTHAGIANSHTLTQGQLPPHAHNYVNAVGGSGSDGGGSYPRFVIPNEQTAPEGGSASHGHNVKLLAAGAHQHTASATGSHVHTLPSLSSHVHTVDNSGAHSHTISDVRPYYYILALIMKVA